MADKKKRIEASAPNTLAGGRWVIADKAERAAAGAVPDDHSTQVVNQGKNDKIVASPRGAGASHIRFGSTKPGNSLSGFPEESYTNAHSIDIVAGVRGADPAPGSVVDASSNLAAAKLSISQRDRPSEYMGLSGDPMDGGLSAITAIADEIALVSRTTQKFVTAPTTTNSQGGGVESVGGFEFITGNNDTDLQPTPKGENLVECIRALQNEIDDLKEIVNGHITRQTAFNITMAAHTHFGVLAWGAVYTFPSVEAATAGTTHVINTCARTIPSLVFMSLNKFLDDLKFLQPLGDKYINNTNVKHS